MIYFDTPRIVDSLEMDEMMSVRAAGLVGLSGLVVFIGSISFSMGQEAVTIASLPSEAAKAAASVTAFCKDMGYSENENADVIQNIGDTRLGRRIVLFQPGNICGYRDRGNGVCDTDGCRFYVFVDDKQGRFTRVLVQSASTTVGYPQEDNKPPIIVTQVRGDDPLCRQDRQSTCILVLAWDGKKFSSAKIR
ncbi:hypothetical protein V5F29_19215 [Xanthobacter aminoxidans]|uniref:hypothetical protein n=1 Tax=Xanthobacter aminoxidans TaxID=186280 RepID=UPI00372CA99A